MTRWWTHVAVVAAWLALGVTVQAQPGYPSPVGAARIPEPLRYTPQDQPQLIAGPLTPAMAPVGPPDCLNLPDNHTSAFQCENFPTETACFATVGAMALRRQGLNHLPVAFLDTQSGGGVDTGVIPTGVGTLPNGNFNPFQTNSTLLPERLNLHEVYPAWTPGARLTIGYLEGNTAFEGTGFYNFEKTSSRERVNQGQLFVPFGPIGGVPAGFQGTNGLWLQADRVQVQFSNETASAELNYRTWDPAINTIELILGVRYFYSREKIGITTDDDYLTRDTFGNTSPLQQATYTATTRNNLVALQMGGEYSTPLPHEYLGWIWLSGMVKSGIGPNFVERNFRLTRGDNLSGFNTSKNFVQVGSISEASLFVDFHILERLRFRAGYMALWALNFSTAGSQVNYDLSNPASRSTDHNSVFWHGPVAEIQFLF